MDLAKQLEIEQLCAKVLSRYAVAVGQRDYDTFVDCFTRDGVWQRPGVPALEGHEQIRAFISTSRPPDSLMRHVKGTVLVDVVDEDTATVISYTTVYSHMGSSDMMAPLERPLQVVEYHDVFKRVGEAEWRIARRDTYIPFRSAEAANAARGTGK